MALSAAEWETKVNKLPNKDELRRLIMWTDARGVKKFPEVNDWRRDDAWQALMRISMEDQLNVENLDFLEDIDFFILGKSWVGREVRPTKDDLYNDYVKTDSTKTINISDTLRKQVAAALLEGDDATLKTALEAADEEITRVVTTDGYRRFQKEIKETVQPAWAKAEAAGKANVVVATAVVHEAPANDEVDNWNAKALKAMSKNTPTDFFQSGVLVIVTNKAAGAAPPGIGWMQQQQGFVTGTITKKGGLFSTATVLATGVRNKFDFEGALRAAIPDIQIEYPEYSDQPKRKVSAFGPK